MDGKAPPPPPEEGRSSAFPRPADLSGLREHASEPQNPGSDESTIEVSCGCISLG